mmetsp:Transcript_8637/g.15843  ORF Transcript_8637/g.15843 Transcript_8637/m.15843 type:complete len:82 (+) Transcript_8637:61-306(+)
MRVVCLDDQKEPHLVSNSVPHFVHLLDLSWDSGLAASSARCLEHGILLCLDAGMDLETVSHWEEMLVLHWELYLESKMAKS